LKNLLFSVILRSFEECVLAFFDVNFYRERGHLRPAGLLSASENGRAAPLLDLNLYFDVER